MPTIPIPKIDPARSHIALIDIVYPGTRVLSYRGSENLSEYKTIIWDISKTAGLISASQIYRGEFNHIVNEREKHFEAFFNSGGRLYILTGSQTSIRIKGMTNSLPINWLLKMIPSFGLLKGEKIDLCTSDRNYMNFWKNCGDIFKYQSFLTNVSKDITLKAHNTDKALGFAAVMSKGELHVLPSLIENENTNNTTPNKYLTKLLDNIDSLKVTDSEEDIEKPEWIGEYLLPNEQETINEFVRLEKEALIIQEKKEVIEQKLLELGSVKVLLFGTGKLLEKQVEHFFVELGFVSQQTESGRDDLILKFEDKIAVVEIKGVKGSSAEKHSAQLEKWASNYYLENSIKPKPILVMNTFRDINPIDRKDSSFPTQMLKYSESREHCLITTYDIFKMLILVRSIKVEKEEFIKSLFETNGIFELSKFE